MHTSFIIFNLIALAIVVTAAFRIGVKVSKAAKREAPEAQNNTKAENSFAPGNEEQNVAKFGRLYTWTSALNIPPEFSEQSPAKDLDMYHKIKEDNYQGIAPEGWHIPSLKEWETLMSNFPEESNGIELRAECCWQRPGEDSVGFFALPAGYRFDNGTYCQFGKRARFWSKDEYGKMNAYRLSLTQNSMDIEGVYRSDAISVRCVKNA